MAEGKAEAKSEELPQISDVRKKVEVYFEFPKLAKKLAQLKVCLRQARCSSIIEAPAFDNLSKECDLLFHKSSVLACESHDLIESFEVQCVKIVGDTKDILRLVGKGMIKLALNKFKSIKGRAEEMEKRSGEMKEKFLSFSEGLVKTANSFNSGRHAASIKKEHLQNQLNKLNSEYKKQQRNLRDYQERLAAGNKEKVPKVPQETTWLNFLSHIGKFSVGTISFEIRSDPNKKWDEFERATQHYEKKVNAKQATLEELSEHETKKTKNMKVIDNLEIIINVLDEGIHVMNDLSATMIKASFFWKSMKEFSSDAIRFTSDTKADLEVSETEMELAEVKSSINKYTDLWEAFGEVCSFSKSQLEKSRDDLLKVMAEKISPAEAESYLQALAKKT